MFNSSCVRVQGNYLHLPYTPWWFFCWEKKIQKRLWYLSLVVSTWFSSLFTKKVDPTRTDPSMGCCFSIVCCGSTPETPPAHLVGTWEGVASDQSKIQMIIDADGNMEWTRTMKGISCSPRQIIAYVKYNHSKFPLTGWNRDVPDEHDYWHTESKLEGTNYAVYPFTRSWKRKV